MGYHFVIKLDGTIQIGRPVDEVGAHVAGHNASTIGIAYVGGVDANDINKAEDTRTPIQIKVMDDLIHDLIEKYGDHITVHGHNEYANKACPSFDVKKDNVRREAARKAVEAPDISIPREELPPIITPPVTTPPIQFVKTSPVKILWDMIFKRK